MTAVRTIPPRPEHFHFVISEEEREIITRLATNAGKTRAQYVRDLVREAHQRTLRAEEPSR